VNAELSAISRLRSAALVRRERLDHDGDLRFAAGGERRYPTCRRDVDDTPVVGMQGAGHERAVLRAGDEPGRARLLRRLPVAQDAERPDLDR